MGSRAALVLACVLPLGGAAANADVVQLGASHDTTIYSESGAESNGAGDHVFAGRTRDGLTRRALLRFDVSSIPAGSTIKGVTLTLHLSRTRTENQTRDAPPPARGLGRGGVARSRGGRRRRACADRRRHLDPPPLPERDLGERRAATSSPTRARRSVVGNETGFYTWSSAGMVADVQAWLDGSRAELRLDRASATRPTRRS